MALADCIRNVQNDALIARERLRLWLAQNSSVICVPTSLYPEHSGGYAELCEKYLQAQAQHWELFPAVKDGKPHSEAQVNPPVPCDRIHSLIHVYSGMLFIPGAQLRSGLLVTTHPMALHKLPSDRASSWHVLPAENARFAAVALNKTIDVFDTTKFATAQKGYAKLLVTRRQCKAFNASPSPFVPSPLMVSFNINLHLAGALAAAASALAGFNPESGQIVAIYWGQNAAANSPENVINIAFITGITPVTVDLANAGRSKIDEDIKICQKKGKTILISMGGGLPTSTNWNSTFGAEKFAQCIWDMFGPVPLDNIYRPFGSAVVDGFDFDFESPINDLPAFAGKLRHLMDIVTDRKFLLSVAPQFSSIIHNPCGIDKAQEGAPSQPHFNFAVWDKWAQKSKNPKVKVLIGIPASNAASRGYTEGTKLKAAIDWAKKYPSFGGVMMWDMAQLYINKIVLQEVVEGLGGGKQPPIYQVTSSVSIDSAKALSSSSPLYVGRW
ncbi:class III chitinase [Cordyceps javanica]|uniref:chitinase n=1 Tax=Cordyceps javanica TaxID=43265 RepID=A0A545VJD0_9HYPO|nr:class III chitinase [Cordyceps javanica]TQW01766.1 class III chitinase [Cordyceps javanica]